MASPTTELDVSRWICVYPLYLDASKTSEGGRKLPLHLSVKNPTAGDIERAARKLGLLAVLETSKRHPKDFFNYGRVRVQLKDEQGEFINHITDRKKLLVALSLSMNDTPLPQIEDSSDSSSAVAAAPGATANAAGGAQKGKKEKEKDKKKK